MDQLAPATNKKNNCSKRKNSKNQQCQHSVQTALTNNHSLQKTPVQQSVKTKPITPITSRKTKTQKLRSPSFRSPQIISCYPVKKRKSSIKKKSLTKKDDKTKKNSKVEVKVREESANILGEEVAKSMYPLSQQQELCQYKSYLIASNGEKIQQEIEDCPSSLEEATPNLLFDSGLMARVPDRIQKLYDESLAMKSGVMSRRQWEEYETLKIKNEELTAYIEELQKIHEEQENKRTAMKTTYEEEKIKFISQIKDLKEEQARLNQSNATLQQLFNQGKQNIDFLTQRLQEMTTKTQKQPDKSQSPSVEAVQRRIFDLQKEVQISRRSIQALTLEKVELSRKFGLVQDQKNAIKKQAQQMLQMLQLIREEQGM